ncbi:fimbrillin family protein [Porphyromonas cangingivalis]|uniref:fimbrillin family protein n=1 Tax=Porphyromonas cangingivalis TaxID=36874 RepID=UPI00242F79E4|nr:fimbrillin family protein [Porphyromonas cangingivalis]
MNRLKTLAWLLVGGMAFASCDKADNSITEPRAKVEFTSIVNNLRVENDSWTTGDEVGVFVLNAGQKNIPAGIYDGKANVKYRAESNGVFTETGTSIIFPKDGSALDFIAYSPYKTDIENGIYNINVVDQSDLSKLDFVYSNNATNKNKTTPRVNLVFDHKLAIFEMVLQVIPGANISLDGAKAVFESILTTATFNLATGELTPGTESAPMNLVVKKISDSKAVISMILIPGTSLEEATMKVTLGGKEYTWKPETKLIEAGKKYVVTTSVGSVEGEIKTIFGSSITDWNIENIEGGTLTPKDPGNNDSGSTPGAPDNGGGSDDQGNGNDQSGNGGSDNPGTPSPTPGQAELLFAGADFEDEAAFKALLLPKFPLPAYATFVDGGRTGKALQIKTDAPKGNDFIFNIQGRDKSFAGKSKISFYIKGTAKKSLSINVYIAGDKKNTAKVFNLGDVSTDKKIKTSATNLYKGTVDTNGQWVKIELDIAEFASNIAKSGDMFAVKVGKEVEYNLLIDDITVE